MRAALFRSLIRRWDDKTPGLPAVLEIQILLDTTARAFGEKGRLICFSRPDAALRKYAEFTTACMSRGEADPERLYREAYKTGSAVRRVTGFKRKDDAERLVRWLYGNIGISMEARLPGDVAVSDCYFSRFYTPEQCALMSYVDSGVIAGICGGGRLEFSERITEGCDRCAAVFNK